MGRIKEFRFTWTDAWHQIDDGYDSILQTSENGAVSITVLVNLKPFVIDITGREDEFIADIEDVGVAEWDSKAYIDPWTLDGDAWLFSLTYDSCHIVAEGMNGYPSSFPQFLRMLHKKYDLPKAKIEDDARISYGIKNAEISEMARKEFATYL